MVKPWTAMKNLPPLPDFNCELVLRRFADRRATLGGNRHGQSCVAKCFFLPAGKKDLTRELAGYAALTRLGLPIARCLDQDFDQSSQTQIIYYEHLTHQTLKHLWHNLLAHEQKDWLQHLARWFATLHQHGFIHRDPHLENFIQSGERKFLLDYAAIQTCSWKKNSDQAKVLNPILALDNLALLLAQFEPDLQLSHCLLNTYAQARNWPWLLTLEPLFRWRAHARYRLRKHRYLRKIFRNCTQSRIIRTAAGYGHCRTTVLEQLKPILENPDDFFHQDSTEILKNGNSATVCAVNMAGLALVIKRYNIKSGWHFLRRAWRPSRARHSWRAAHLLEFHGLPSATPLAWLQSKKWGMNYRSYFISQQLQGKAITIDDKSQCEDIIAQLHHYHISHGDLKATNFILQYGKPYLIDLDATSNSYWKNKLTRAYDKDWARWEKNWL
jgi:tRNA A-37 threonylcarbamoyl transferase component Bud32